MSSVFNKAGRASIANCVDEKKKVKEEKLEEAILQEKNHQEECVTNDNPKK